MADAQSSSSSSSSSSPPPPHPNRYITTTTTPDAKAIFAPIPAPIEPLPLPGGALLRLGYQLPGPAPTSLAGDADLTAYLAVLPPTQQQQRDDDDDNNKNNKKPPASPIPSGGGVAIWYVDTPPGAAGPPHRTLSVDVAVQLEGETELRLGGGGAEDDDEEGEKQTRLLRPGDMAVQRATLHAWRNPSGTRWSRMLVFMSECEPLVVGGEILGAYPPPPQQQKE